MPLVLVLAARTVLAAARHVLASRLLPGLVSVLAVLAVLCVVNYRFAPEITMHKQSQEEYLNEKRTAVVLALEKFTRPDATVGLFGVGTIPYYTGRPAVDFLGKMDPRIAHCPQISPTPAPGTTSTTSTTP